MSGMVEIVTRAGSGLETLGGGGGGDEKESRRGGGRGARGGRGVVVVVVVVDGAECTGEGGRVHGLGEAAVGGESGWRRRQAGSEWSRAGEWVGVVNVEGLGCQAVGSRDGSTLVEHTPGWASRPKSDFV